MLKKFRGTLFQVLDSVTLGLGAGALPLGVFHLFKNDVLEIRYYIIIVFLCMVVALFSMLVGYKLGKNNVDGVFIGPILRWCSLFLFFTTIAIYFFVANNSSRRDESEGSSVCAVKDVEQLEALASKGNCKSGGNDEYKQLVARLNVRCVEERDEELYDRVDVVRDTCRTSDERQVQQKLGDVSSKIELGDNTSLDGVFSKADFDNTKNKVSEQIVLQLASTKTPVENGSSDDTRKDYDGNQSTGPSSGDARAAFKRGSGRFNDESVLAYKESGAPKYLLLGVAGAVTGACVLITSGITLGTLSPLCFAFPGAMLPVVFSILSTTEDYELFVSAVNMVSSGTPISDLTDEQKKLINRDGKVLRFFKMMESGNVNEGQFEKFIKDIEDSKPDFQALKIKNSITESDSAVEFCSKVNESRVLKLKVTLTVYNDLKEHVAKHVNPEERHLIEKCLLEVISLD